MSSAESCTEAARLADAGQWAQAEHAYRQCVAQFPESADAYYGLGNALLHLNRLDEAVAAYELAVERRPSFADAFQNMGVARVLAGRLDEAVEHLRHAIDLNPSHVMAHDNLGNALRKQGRLEEAEAQHREAILLDPSYASGYNNLSLALKEQRRITEAIAQAEQAVALDPNSASGHANLGQYLLDVGRVPESIAHLRAAVRLRPSAYQVHSNLLLALQYDESVSPAEVFAEHRRYNALHAAPLAASIQTHQNDRRPERRLRVGYVSAAFCRGVIAFFLEPLLTTHDRAQYAVYCYADVAAPDVMTRHLQRLGHAWRDIWGKSDEAVARMVRDDRIDILVDLDGHTGNARLPLFARKPAPIQVTYLGYPATTGLDAMDYRITDAWADPVGRTESLHSEQLVRLPQGFLCYQSPLDAPAVDPLPALANGFVTFGCFNKLPKMGPAVAALWASVLQRVPGSRLLLKTRVASDEEMRRRIAAMFAQHGIEPERIELLERSDSVYDHLALYNRMDVALDPFPYNGTTTTCEALWMGVPVVALAGSAHVSRVGVSLLSQLGLAELIGDTPESYAEAAVALAGDLDRLQQLRRTLRDRVRRAPLTDSVRLTRSLESAYRGMWQRWCGVTEEEHQPLETLSVGAGALPAHRRAPMRFGTVDTFLEPGEWRFRMGRPVANEGFLQALLRHGSYDEYHFFCPDTAYAESLGTTLETLVPDKKLRSRVHIALHVTLAERLRSEDFDIFHLGDFTRSLPYLTGIRDQHARRPFPITGVTHSLDGLTMHRRFVELCLAGIAPFDGIVCTSTAAKALVAEKLAEAQRLLRVVAPDLPPVPARTTVIPLGVEDELFEHAAPAEARAFFNIPADRTVALSVGRLSLRTKTDWAPVLELLARMRRAGELQNALFIIAGGGADSNVQQLEQLVDSFGLGETVALFPNFPPQAKSKLYRAADFYFSIVDNFQETFGLNVVEAMASGLPVIASDFSGYRDAVTEGENGFLIPTLCPEIAPPFLGENLGILDPGIAGLLYSQMVAPDLARLREAFLALTTDEALRKRMGDASARLAARYRWNAVIRAHEAFWSELQAEARRAPEAPRRVAEILKGDPLQAYLGFPSRRLQASDALALTEVGRAALDRPDVLTRYRDVEPTLRPDVERIVLDTLRRGSHRLEQLRQLAETTCTAEAGQVDYQVAWLLKHGAIALTS